MMPSTPLRPRDLLVEFRDRNLERQGSIPINDLQLKFQPVYNGVGSWLLTLPAEHRAVPYLRAPGAGIVITNLVTGDILMSGSTSKPSKKATISDPKGMTSIAGLDDNRLAFDARAFPLPTTADVKAQTVGHDVRSGAGSSLMRAYVDANIGPASPVARRGSSLRNAIVLGPDPIVGATTTQRARYDNLGELLNKIASEAGGVGWRFVQVGDFIEFQTYEPTDRSAFIRLDVVNGTLQETSTEFAPPELTRSIVAGQGELEDRQFVMVTTPESEAAEADWGLIIEDFKDQRQTNVEEELEQAGIGDLNERGFTKVAVKAVPSNDQTMIFLTDFFLGDRVSVVIDGQEQPNSNITEAAIVVDRDGMKTAVAIGDIADFDSDSALRQTVTDNTRRISAIERNIERAEIPVGSTKMGLLAKEYVHRDAIGPAKVVVDGVVSDTAYEWMQQYDPFGPRSVILQWDGHDWKIAGQTYDAQELHPLAGEYPLTFANSWLPYDERYQSESWANGRAVVLPSGIVSLSGLIWKQATGGGNEVIARIPAEIAPDSDQYFAVNNGDAAKGIVVKSNGDIMIPGTTITGSFIGLDRIAYPAKGVAQWTEVGAAGSGSSWGPLFEDYLYGGIKAMYWKDPYGFVWYRGLAKVKTAGAADNASMIVLPASHRTAAGRQGHFRTVAQDGYGGTGTMEMNGLNYKGGTPNAVGNWISLAGIVTASVDAHGSSINNWIQLDWMTNSWAHYGDSFPPASVTRRLDGLVCWRGLVRAGTFGAGLGRMPNEAIPRETRLIEVMSNQARGRVDLWGLDRSFDSPGRGILYMNQGSNAWFSLDGISYAP